MSTSRFVPSTSVLIGVAVAVGLLTYVLVGTGAIGSEYADSRELARIVRAVLLATATTLFGVVFLKVLAYYRDPATGLGKWLGIALAGAAGCLLAAWILTVQLR